MRKLQIPTDIIADILTTHSVNECSKILNISPSYIYEVVKTNNLIVHNSRKRCSFTFDFFKSIDTEAKSYILGFIISDGWIASKANRIGICIAEKDKDILYKIQKEIKHTGKLRAISFESKQNQLELTLTNKQTYHDIKSHGIDAAKSFTAHIPFNSVPFNLIKHLIRGIFDGDGSFSGQRPCIVTSSPQLVTDLNYFCTLNGYPKLAIYQHKNNFKLSFKNCHIPLLNSIYVDSNIHVNRKYQQYLDYISYKKSIGRC